MKTDDKRYLCRKCVTEYRDSGFVLKQTHKEYTDGCERCSWHLAHEYKIKPKS